MQTSIGDAFRAVRPDEVSDPGYTWTPGYPPPNLNRNEVHDRIDFVYFAGDDVIASDAVNIGLNTSNPSTDIGVTGYPSDHRAVLTTFTVPEPPSMDLLGLGVGCLLLMRHRRR